MIDLRVIPKEPGKVEFTGKLVRLRTPKEPRSEKRFWAEVFGHRPTRYYPDFIALKPDVCFTPGKGLHFKISSRVNKIFDGYENGDILKIEGYLYPWKHNNEGGDLRRVKVLGKVGR